MNKRNRKAAAPQAAKIKICGLFRPCDIDAVNLYRPDYAGFITYPKSHRFVTMEQAKQLRDRLDSSIRSVAVFVNKPVEEVVPYVKEGIADIVQLHGSEDEMYLRELRRALPKGTPVIKAFTIRSTEDLRTAENSTADFILLDNGLGTGQTFDWNLLGARVSRPFFLAGGLGPDNVGRAVRSFRPYAVDISSGAETNREKDPEKIRACIEAVRNAAGQ